MYHNNFVAVVKSNNKVLRERDNLVYIPFGSEYSILLKNLDSRKCVVKVNIDGQNVLDNKSIILFPNIDFELLGFMKNMVVTNRFKFIQKTQEISDFRGDKIDDGIIRVEFTFEKKKEPLKWYYNNIDHTNRRANDDLCMAKTVYMGGIDNYSYSFKDDGITVKGSEVNQYFNYGYTDELEATSYVINLKLKATKNNEEYIQTPLYTIIKLKCKTCGRTSDSDCKYCSNCGTYLDIP